MNQVRVSQNIGMIASLALLSASAHAAPKKIVFPNPAYPNLQAAVDAVANGGTVQIKTGVYTDPGVTITNKKVTIIGTLHGLEVTELRPTTTTTTLFYGKDNSNLTIRNLYIDMVSGSTGTAIRLQSMNFSDPATRPILSLASVGIYGGSSGVYSSAKKVTIKNCYVSGASGPGVRIGDFDTANISGGDYSGNGFAGIAINGNVSSTTAATGTASIYGVRVGNNNLHGISVFGGTASQRKVIINKSTINGNVPSGVAIYAGTVTIAQSDISYNISTSGDFLGSGIYAQSANLNLVGNLISSNDHGGINTNTCQSTNVTVNLTMKGNRFEYNPRGNILSSMSYDTCGGTSLNIIQKPGNTCDSGSSNGTNNCSPTSGPSDGNPSFAI